MTGQRTSRSDRCDHCGKRIRFVATKAAELPCNEFCSALCMDRYRRRLRRLTRDREIWQAWLRGETVAEHEELTDELPRSIQDRDLADEVDHD